MGIKYLLSSETGYVEASKDDLSLPWLVAPNYPHPTLSLGDVFQIIKEEINGMPFMKDIALGMPESLVIRSEKHGPFYHVFSIGDFGRSWFGVILAGHQKGKDTLREDLCNLQALGAKAMEFFPKCYALKEVKLKGSNESILLGIVEWLNEYYEVHASKEGKTLKFELWNPEGYRSLSHDEVIRFYEGAVKVVFNCYNPSTQERLCTWTHITGDFVFNPDSANPHPVKLTTVRGLKSYRSLPSDPELRTIYANLLWLLETILINRLDRDRGIGELLLFPSYVLKATLDAYVNYWGKLDNSFRIVLNLLKEMDSEEILTLYEIVLDEVELGEEVKNFLRGELTNHIQELLTYLIQ